MDKQDEFQDPSNLDPNLSSILKQLVTQTNSARDQHTITLPLQDPQ